MRCRDLVELVTEYLEGTLDSSVRKRFEAHLSICPLCAEYVAQFRITIASLGCISLDDLDHDRKHALVGAFAEFGDEWESPAALARLRAGDHETFAVLVDAWSPSMLHVAARYVQNRQTAEDVVQDTWLAVLKGLPAFEGRGTLRSWAFSILLNRARTTGTRERRLVPMDSVAGGEYHPTVDPGRFQGPDGKNPGGWTSTGAPRPWHEPDTAALLNESACLVAKALEDLPERQRVVVQLRDVVGFTSDEACATLDITAANQRVLLHRGRAALRLALEDYHV